MAVLGKEAILELVRYNDVPFWTIYETEKDRDAGNFTAQFRPEGEGGNHSLETSISQLSITLGSKLSPGRYIFTAYKNKGQSKGGIRTFLEVGGNGGNMQPAAVAGIGATMFVDGVGKVGPDNLMEAMEAFYEKKEKERKEREKLETLERENVELKKAAAEKDGVIERGLYSIGAMLWPQLKQTPAVKEMMQAVMGAPETKRRPVPTDNPEYVQPAIVMDGTGTEDNDNRLSAALETLADGDEDFLEKIEALARLKKTNPTTYAQGIDFVQNMG